MPRFEQIDDVRDVTVTGVADDAVTITLDVPALAGVGPVAGRASRTILQDNGVVHPHRAPSTRATRPCPSRSAASCPRSRTSRALPLRRRGPPPVDARRRRRRRRSRPVPATSYSRLDGEPALAVVADQDARRQHGRGLARRAGRGRGPARRSWATTSRSRSCSTRRRSSRSPSTASPPRARSGLLFAVLVILLFLGSVRSTLVSAISIPLSLLVTFVGLQRRRLLAEHPHARRPDHRDRPRGRRLDRRHREHQAAPVLRRGQDDRDPHGRPRGRRGDHRVDGHHRRRVPADRAGRRHGRRAVPAVRRHGRRSP